MHVSEMRSTDEPQELQVHHQTTRDEAVAKSKCELWKRRWLLPMMKTLHKSTVGQKTKMVKLRSEKFTKLVFGWHASSQQFHHRCTDVRLNIRALCNLDNVRCLSSKSTQSQCNCFWNPSRSSPSSKLVSHCLKGEVKERFLRLLIAKESREHILFLDDFGAKEFEKINIK